jgi:hypothetical protein
MKRILLLCATVGLSLSAFCADEPPKPITYHLQIAQYSDTFSKAPEYVYVVGEVACRSLRDLEKVVSHFPKGSTLQWAPSCRGPAMLSEKEDRS